uniref:Lipoprotein n=1 Tax=Trichogramma kaykai TaxID=54128 RepID=A0ABD2WUG6_9HYME
MLARHCIIGQLIGSSLSRRTTPGKEPARALKKTNNAFFRPCRVLSFTGAILASLGACKARSHCEEK